MGQVSEERCTAQVSVTIPKVLVIQMAGMVSAAFQENVVQQGDEVSHTLVLH